MYILLPDYAAVQIASPTFTGTVSGLTKTMVSLSNVDNTSDANKPVSTAQAAANTLKLNLTGGTLTGALNMATGSANGLVFAIDTNLYRSAADTLKTDDSLIVGAQLVVGSPATTDTAPALYIAGPSARSYTAANKIYRDVASFAASGFDVAGTIKITMPKSWSNTQVQIRISGNPDNTSAGWEVIVGGYNAASGSSWIYTGATVRGRAPFSSIRLAHDGTTNVLLLGTTSTSWEFPHIQVTEVQAAYSNVDGWGTGWSISQITSETGITSIVTPPTVAVGAVGVKSGMILDWDTNLYRNGADTLKTDDALCIGGNVGFYGTSPAAKPTVTGSRVANAALASLLTALAGLGLLTDSSS